MAKDKAFQAAEKKIANALLTGATKLDLSCGWDAEGGWDAEDLEKLTELPDSLGRLTALQSLTLSNNQLAALPESLGRLTQLQSLNLSNNQLAALPESLGRLTALQLLNLRNNQLTALPESLGQLTALQSLDLSGNQQTVLPESLAQLTALQSLELSDNRLTVLPESMDQLTALQSLDLSNNQLTVLPESLGQLTALQSLDLSNNQLTALPESLGQLTALQTLDLSDNQLAALPDWLGLLTQLRELSLSINPIVSLPNTLVALRNLKSLTLAKTNLENLPEAFGELSGLEYLALGHTPLTHLPAWIGDLRELKGLDLSRDGEVIIRWTGNRTKWMYRSRGGRSLVELPESISHLTSLKTLYLHGNEALGIPPEVLGPGWDESRRGGKVPADPQAILGWYFQSRAEPVRRLNEAKMLLVGQGVVGKTSLVHYLIHNRRCDPGELPTEGINIDDWETPGKKGANGKYERVNVHVWDFGGQEIMHATHQFFLTRRSLYLLLIDARAGEKESNIHYWLKIIQSFGGDSPVLVVVNKCDQHPHELNETRLMRDYPNIRGFIQTSCTSGKGIATLRREIGKQVRSLPHVFDKLPVSFFEVKAELARVAAERHFIPIEEYRRICADHAVEKLESQDRLIRFLHDLGVVLNFQDPADPYGQNDPFVLNPPVSE